MTFEEKRRLAIQAEIQKLRAVARSFENLVRQVQAEAAEFRHAAMRFEVIAEAEEILDTKIQGLEALHRERRKVAETKGELRGTIVDITRTLGGL